MTKCKFCGAETSLYVSGVPICIECEKKAEAARNAKKAAQAARTPEQSGPE
jgi:hypothetical protein